MNRGGVRTGHQTHPDLIFSSVSRLFAACDLIPEVFKPAPVRVFLLDELGSKLSNLWGVSLDLSSGSE